MGMFLGNQMCNIILEVDMYKLLLFNKKVKKSIK